jgi:uncharacterized protein (DUF885 family)
MLPRLVLALLMFAVAPAYAADASSADARFTALYSREWDWRKAEFPDADDSPTKPVADHLPKVDEASQQRRLAYWTEVMSALDAIPRAALSAKAQLDYDVYRPIPIRASGAISAASPNGRSARWRIIAISSA